MPAKRLGGRGYALFAGLFLLCGCMAWLSFFNFGHMNLSFKDWLMHGHAIDVARLCLQQKAIPYTSSLTFQRNHIILGFAHLGFSPTLLLLPWMSTGWFIPVNVCFWFAVGVFLMAMHAWKN